MNELNTTRNFFKILFLSLAVNFIICVGFVHAIPGPIDLSTLTRNGSAIISGGALRLTDSASDAGSAFISTPFTIGPNTSFKTFFRFRIHGLDGTGGADGFTFMFQNDSANDTALGGGGGNLGYESIDNSLAIEFDTWANGFPINDPNSNHIGIDIDGSLTSLQTYMPGFNLNGGGAYYAWIDYNGYTDSLEVYVSTSSLKPASPQLTQSIDLFSIVGSQAYIGFSGGTGLLANYHDIESWELNEVYLNPENQHWYEAICLRTTSIEWPDARSQAQLQTFNGVQGHLATITSQQENDFIRDNVYPSEFEETPVWVGGSQLPFQSTPSTGWGWVTGEEWLYTNWDSGQPNDQDNTEDNDENCLEYAIDGEWNDQYCNEGLRCYIVEYERESIPTLSQWGMIIFVVLAGLGAVYYLRRQRKLHR